MRDDTETATKAVAVRDPLEEALDDAGPGGESLIKAAVLRDTLHTLACAEERPDLEHLSQIANELIEEVFDVLEREREAVALAALAAVEITPEERVH